MIAKLTDRKSLLWEAGLSLAALAGLAAVFASFDVFEELYKISRAHKDYELDDILAALLALPAILLIFLIRRLKDLKKEMGLRVQAQDKAHALAARDPLTGLANRVQFFSEIKSRLETGQVRRTRFALFHIDLDRFKQINDRYGPIVGDGVLKQVAELLESRLDKGATLARISSDEFLLLKPYKHRSEISNFGIYLVNLLDRPFSYQGIERKEFTAFLQPIVDAKTFQVVGAEALVRWQHPKKGTLAPAAFMDAAESLGVISDIDQFMFEEAIRIRNKFKENCPVAPRISINISADRLKSPLFLHTVRNINVEPDALVFEISEAVTFESLDDMSRFNLEALADQGFEVEIDDFGSGRASILSLLEMRPKRLKIDRNLTAPIVDTEGSRKLVKSVVDMATGLGIEVVAEGVETLEHATILANQGCHLLQGYYFARPMSEAEFIDYLKAQPVDHASVSGLIA